MAKQITCECGFIARADSDDEVMQQIREHMRSDHPELLESVTRDDLLGWIEEVGADGDHDVRPGRL
jgi:predicted small metal-binding protein